MKKVHQWLPPRSCGKVMFSQVSLHQSFCPKGGGSPCVHYPLHWDMRPTLPSHPRHQTWDLHLPRHQTWPTLPHPRHQTWDLHSPPPPTPDMGPLPLATDIWWSSLEACSNLFTWGPSSLPPSVVTFSDGHWNMYGLQAASAHPTGMYSCWNCTLKRLISLVTKI